MRPNDSQSIPRTLSKMKTTVPSAFKRLASKIHPPLPLSHRDSQKLLNAVTTSFRHRLNEEHATQQSAPTTNITDAHIRSILSNPLLSLELAVPTSESRKKPMTRVVVLEKVRQMSSGPLYYFAMQIAMGQATLETARQCLTIHRKNIGFRKNAVDGTFGGGKDSVPSSLMLSWLFSSGLAQSMEFLHDTGFTKLLVPFLVEDGKERQIWIWLKRTRALPATAEEGHSAGGLLLLQLVRSKFVTEPDGLPAALRTFNEAVQRLSSDSSPNTDLFRRAGVFLARKLVKRDISQYIDVNAYDLVVQKIGRINSGYWKACLDVHHPTAPSPDDAMLYLERYNQEFGALGGLHQRYIVPLSWETADLLFTKRRNKEAESIVSSIKTASLNELNRHPSRIDENSEKISQEILDSMAAV